jgi:uncharacterized protein YbaP (TraB family)
MRLALLSLLVPALALALWQPAAQAAPSAPVADSGCPPLAQMPTPEQMQQAQAAAKDRGALWRLRKDGRVSYLYGTVHVGKLAWAAPGPQLKAAMAATEVLAVEVDPTAPGFMAEVQAAQARAARLELTPADQARLDAEADAACVPRAALAALHPLMQAITYVTLSGRRDGLDPAFSQEAVLIGAARALGRPVVALETVAGQMAALLPGDSGEARAMLGGVLDSLKSHESRTTVRRLSQAWERGDLDAMASPAALCECTPTAEDLRLMRRVNDERNPNLADRIAAEHAKGKPVLAAVGTLHMTGPKALPALLQQRGFEVERLRY